MPKKNVSQLKSSYLAAFLVMNSITWIFMTRKSIRMALNTFNITDQQSLIVWMIFNLTIIIFGIIGAALSLRIRRFSIIYFWMFSGIIASFLFYFLLFLSSFYFFFIILFWSASFGLGMPSCLAYFADSTTYQNRGSIGGIIFFTSNLLAFLVIITPIDYAMNITMAIIWRTIGLAPLILMKASIGDSVKKYVSFSSIICDRKFLLYVIPWFMFSLVYGFQKIILEQALEYNFYNFLLAIETAIGTFSALIFGVLCDRIGRKRIIVFGFVSLGIAYATISIASNFDIFWYLFCVVDGIAWGIFLLMFVLVLWGDLSSLTMKNHEKYYAAGPAPFFLADLISFLFAPYAWIPFNLAFSVASFFLFLAVVPLMYAPETLPEKEIRRRELKKYVEKAKKLREKYEKGED